MLKSFNRVRSNLSKIREKIGEQSRRLSNLEVPDTGEGNEVMVRIYNMEYEHLNFFLRTLQEEKEALESKVDDMERLYKLIDNHATITVKALVDMVDSRSSKEYSKIDQIKALREGFSQGSGGLRNAKLIWDLING